MLPALAVRAAVLYKRHLAYRLPLDVCHSTLTRLSQTPRRRTAAGADSAAGPLWDWAGHGAPG